MIKMIPSAISELDCRSYCRSLHIIMRSQLLTSNDLSFISTCIPPEENIYLNRYRRGAVAVTVAAALNTGVILLNKSAVSSLLKTISLIPACLVSAGSIGYIGKIICNSYKEKTFENQMKNHIKILKMFEKLVQIIIGDISTIDMSSRGFGLRSLTSGSNENQACDPLAEFCKAFFTILTKIHSTMSCELSNLVDLVSDAMKETAFASISMRILFPENITFDETQVSVDNLNIMNRVFQLVESAYLSWLALCLSQSKNTNEILTSHLCTKSVKSVHLVVTESYNTLKTKYIANLCGRRHDKVLVEKQNITSTGHINFLGDHVHTIVMQLMSLIGDIKHLENSFDKWNLRMAEKEQSTEETIKLFAKKFNKFKIKLKNISDYISKVDVYKKKQIIIIYKSTGTDNSKEVNKNLSGIAASATSTTGISDSSIDSAQFSEAVTIASSTPFPGSETDETTLVAELQSE